MARLREFTLGSPALPFDVLGAAAAADAPAPTALPPLNYRSYLVTVSAPSCHLNPNGNLWFLMSGTRQVDAAGMDRSAVSTLQLVLERRYLIHLLHEQQPPLQSLLLHLD